MRRFLFKEEKTQRGCCYCADAIIAKIRVGCGKHSKPMFVEAAKYCPYARCPYRELDNCRSFVAWLKKKEKEDLAWRRFKNAFKTKKL